MKSNQRNIPVLFAIFLFSFLFSSNAKSQQLELTSPNGEIKLSLHIKDKLYYTISYNDETLLKDCYLQLNLKDEILGQNPKLTKQSRQKGDEIIKPIVPLKFSTVRNQYNSLLLTFKGNYSVEFKAFDDGIAYRFITNKKNEIEITGEDFVVNFPNNYLMHLQQVGGFKTPYEEPYTHLESDKFTDESRLSVLPILIDTKKHYKILISETDLLDYPVMLIKGVNNNGIKGTFPKYPTKYEDDGDRSQKILEEADYIAKTDGKRTFPWRYFVITKEDSQIVENTMNLKLASSNQIKDLSWIKSGQTVWDWWNYAMPYGVDFVAGRNQDTYKYFIDFAAKHNIPYSLLDEGWAKSGYEPFEANPNVNIHELVSYANERNVKILLWLPWLAAENNLTELFKTYKEWGIAGIKVDFMERNDQWMVNYYERVAKEAAANELIVLFHGSFKPAGLEYRYPNILSYEGVRGLEWKGEATPDNSIYLPFMRNAVGSMDYTPGAMVSMQPEYYITSDYNPSAVGTRAYQLSHFIIFESGIQMLADNPTRYNKDPECFDFITQLPVTWDETKALAAKVGEYVVVAKRKGDKWFIGAMTNSKQSERIIEINLDFLNKEQVYQMTTFEDGLNANRIAMDYKKTESEVRSGETIKIKMVKNGGWAAIIQ